MTKRRPRRLEFKIVKEGGVLHGKALKAFSSGVGILLYHLAKGALKVFNEDNVIC
jgi:hypothetical protein